MVRRTTEVSETAVVRRQRRWSPTERRRWLERFERSGLSLRVFCRKHGVPVSTLLFWRRQARRAVGAGVIEVPSAAVRAAAASGAARGIAIRLPNHIELEVCDHADPKWVAALVREALACSG